MPAAAIRSPTREYVSSGRRCPGTADRNRHSSRYRVCMGGCSVDQVKMTRSPDPLCSTGVRSADSAVSEVCTPHTTGTRSAGKSSRTDSRRVGIRTARWKYWPHLSSPTWYRYVMVARWPRYSGKRAWSFSNSSQTSLKESRS